MSVCGFSECDNMSYWRAEIWELNNMTRVGHVTGKTVKELRHEFTLWKKEHGIAVNSDHYYLLNRIWVRM